MDTIGVRFNPMSEIYVSLLFENADSNYAEVYLCVYPVRVFN
jgi:proteasome activator subunit 4